MAGSELILCNVWEISSRLKRHVGRLLGGSVLPHKSRNRDWPKTSIRISAMASNSDGASAAITLRDFLESVPPGQFSDVVDLGGDITYPASGSRVANLNRPEIMLYCDSDACNGNRFFSTKDNLAALSPYVKLSFVTFFCKNCSSRSKTFALWFKFNDDLKGGRAYKYGEVPAFGPPTPARLVSLIGPQRDLFLKGRRAENQGMGIAAFAYYRRVIEDQKDRIFDEVIKVSRGLSADQAVIDDLQKAKTETQFIKAVEAVKHAIPQALLINGRNPLTLLHSALSEGLHAHTDDDCLEIATSIRVVMAEFAERMAQVIKDEAELNEAVSRLLRKKAVPKPTVEAKEPGALTVD